LLCGEIIGQAISKAQVPDGCLAMDEALLASRRAERRQKYEEVLQKHVRKQKAQRSAWWARYKVYLASPEWHAISSKVRKRADGICEGCGAAPATQVHHLSYTHAFNEFLFELVAVCDRCHDRLHRENDLTADEWGDDFPCQSCRFQDEKDHRRWCGVFDVLAVEALSAEGQCGPNRAGYEPMK
jgi:hypothetical protein